jgi:hypothetical protein
LTPFVGLIRLVPRGIKLDDELTGLLQLLPAEIRDEVSVLFHALVSTNQERFGFFVVVFSGQAGAQQSLSEIAAIVGWHCLLLDVEAVAQQHRFSLHVSCLIDTYALVPPEASSGRGIAVVPSVSSLMT